MTSGNLFNIILKIVGILFIRDVIVMIPDLLSVFFFIAKGNSTEAILTLTSAILMAGIYSLVAYYLIFKTEIIIQKFRLDKGYDEEPIPLNIHRSTVLSISIIVIGGLLITDQIPNLCRQLFLYFQEKRMTYGQTHPSISYSILAGSKILIGLLLILNQRHLVMLIERNKHHKGG